MGFNSGVKGLMNIFQKLETVKFIVLKKRRTIEKQINASEKNN